MTYLGKAIPDYTYGITLNLAYKGLDLNVFGAGVGGNDIFTVLYRADTPMRNSLKYYYDNAWTPNNKNASMPDPKAIANDWHFWGSQPLCSVVHISRLNKSNWVIPFRKKLQRRLSLID